MTILLWVLATTLVVVGLIGIVLPALPGTILIFLGLLLATWADGFSRVGVATLVVIGVIAAASYAVDSSPRRWGPNTWARARVRWPARRWALCSVSSLDCRASSSDHSLAPSSVN